MMIMTSVFSIVPLATPVSAAATGGECDDNAVVRQSLVDGFGLFGGQTCTQIDIPDLGGEGLADGLKSEGHCETP